MTRTSRSGPKGTRAALALILIGAAGAGATPEYFASVANQALRLDGGAALGGDLGVQAVRELEQQVKRVMGADPALDLNVSALRDRADPELLRILLLAVLGNYTTAAAQPLGAAPDLPCGGLVVDPRTGRVRARAEPAAASLALKVVVVLLVAVQLQRRLADARAEAAAATEPPQAGKTS